MKKDWKFIFDIFITFLKIGPVTFGGGYAMIPVIEREVIDKKKWIKSNDVTEVFAIAESVPGAIAINSATFIGYRLAGARGAFAAMTGVLLPTFLIVVLLSILFIYVKDNPLVEAAFTSIRVSIVALIAYAAYKIGLTAIYDKTTFIFMTISVFCLLYFKMSPVLIILIGIFAGIGLIRIKDRLGLKTNLEKLQNKINSGGEADDIA